MDLIKSRLQFYYKKYFVAVLCMAIFFVISFLVLSYPLSYEGSDNYIHYKFSRYSWIYPWLFLDHWGKPLFTILSSPFSQFGYVWAKSFNLLTGFGTALLTYQTVKQLKYANAWISIPFVCLSPMYFIMFNTTMTEILCSFLIILSVLLFFKNKYLLCAMVISFIPMARSEGYLFMLFFMYVFIIQARYKFLPFFFSGILLFSVIGKYYYYHDFFWLFSQNPYKDTDIYGSGNLFHFVRNFRALTGIGISGLIITGSIGLLVNAFRESGLKGLFTKPVLLLILYPAWSYIIIHSMLWWLGKFASIGELRVVTVVIPLLAVIALFGYNMIFSFMNKNLILLVCFNLLLCFLMYRDIIRIFPTGYRLSDTEKVVKAGTDWLKSTEYVKNKIYYYNPLIFILLNLNPYDSTLIQEKVPDFNHPENEMKNGSVVIWDAHLGPNEGRLPLKNLLNNKNFKLLNLFRPEFPFKVLGGYDYEVYIFQRVSEFKFENNQALLKMYDFENPQNNPDSTYLTDEKSHSGSHCFKLDHNKLYSPAFTSTIGDLRKAGIIKITASGFLLPLYDPVKNNTALIISFERDTVYNYHGIELWNISWQLNKWNQLSISSYVPSRALDQDIVKVYFYQPGNDFIYLDDFKIEGLKLSY